MVGKCTRVAEVLALAMIAGLPLRAQSSAPVITSPATADYGWIADNRDVDPLYRYRVTASNSPTSFSATGLPPFATIDAQSGIISGRADDPGVYAVTVSATNASGTGTGTVTLRIHVVPEGASQAVGLFHVGDTIQAYVFFNGPVTVTGQPILKSGVAFHYASGSGTGGLTFTHTVTSADPTGYIDPSFTWDVSAGAITDKNGLSAVSSIPDFGPTAVGYTIIDNPAPPVVAPIPGRLINLSVLTFTGPGSQLLTVGFVTGGGKTGTTQSLLLRGVGPGLASFGVKTPEPDPALTLYQSQTAIAFNDNWAGAAAVRAASTSTGAFVLSDGSLDAALLATLTSGAYTVQINAATPGNALAEIYDASSSYNADAPHLVNLSCLSRVAIGDTLTAGFVIGGTTSRRVLIRAAGPALTALGVTNVMTDPTLSLYASTSNGAVLRAQNAGWGGDATLAATFQSVGAFSFTDPHSTDCAIVTTLAPGNYTAQAHSTSGASGTVLVEVYEAP